MQDDIDVSVIVQKLTPLLCSSELKVRVNAGKIAARVVLAVKGPYLQPFTTDNATQVRTTLCAVEIWTSDLGKLEYTAP